MNTLLQRYSVIALVTIALSGCVVAGGGYDANVGVGVDYYEPVGGVYGVWGPGYHVGPYRDGGHVRDAGSGSHAYRSAPASHPMPSIPSHFRGR